QLDVVVAFSQRSLHGLPHGGKGLGEDVVQRRVDLLSLPLALLLALLAVAGRIAASKLGLLLLAGRHFPQLDGDQQLAQAILEGGTEGRRAPPHLWARESV